MEIFQVSRNTIYNWFNTWDKNGLVGLYDRKGRGRKHKFNIGNQQKIKEWVKENTKNLNNVRDKIHKEFGIITSIKTIKIIIKKL